MDDHCSSVENPYANVLASFSHENESCVEEALQTHTLEADGSFTSELVGMDELTIVTSSSEVSGRLASRIISGELGSLVSTKTIEISPDDLLEESSKLGEQSISFKPIFSGLRCKTDKWKLNSLDGQLISDKKHSLIDTGICSSDNSQLGRTELNNILNFSVNQLPLQSTNNTAVEQPNVGPCSCFICGQVLIDFSERFSYMKSQKLFNLKIPLLQLLSDIISQTVLTNTDSIDLCQKCSELMNEVDITYKHLNGLKEEINTLFSVNNRPKLTFHVLPKPSIIPKNLMKKSNDVNLSELAYTRPRRGRSSKSEALKRNKKIDTFSEIDRQTKRKGGRPRKPFQCHICKRKFLTQSLSEKHFLREHYDDKVTSVTPLNREVNKNISSTNNTNLKVKEENDDNCNVDKSDLIIMQNQPLLSLLQQSTSVPTFSKISVHSGFQSNVRPIQPKPQTLVQTATDGSLMFFMNPTTKEALPTLIKVSPGYLNLKADSHTCDLCKKSFLDDRGYKMHRIAAHGVRKRKLEFEVSCNEGGSVNEYNGSVNEYNKESIQKMWQCEQCQVVFSSKKLFFEHKRLPHANTFRENISKEPKKEKTYSCDGCEQIFPYKYKMENHRESHLPFNQVGPHEFVCCICGLKVASKAALKIHLHRFHSSEEESKEFLCAECGYMTGTKKAFSDHLRIHSETPGQKKVCKLCRKEMLPSSYKIHMLRIHGEAKYPCNTCGQRFNVRSDLMKHLNTIHSTLRPYDCGLCGDKFVTSEALRYHKNKIHSMVFHFCENCGKSCKWKGELRAHISRCHNETRTRHQCTVCSKSYADRRKLCHHIATKHNTTNEEDYIRHQCSKTAAEVNEIMSSDYEPQVTLISTPEPSLAPMSCASTTTELQLVAGEESLNVLHEFDSHRQSTLETLHSQAPLSHQACEIQQSLSHEQNSTSLHYKRAQPIQITGPDILPHSIETNLARLQHKGNQLDQDVHSFYLVSDMHMTLAEKQVSTS